MLITKTRHLIIYLLVWVVYFTTLFCTASCKTKTITQEHYITDNTKSTTLDKTWQERFISAFEQMSSLRNREHESSLRESTHVKDSTSTTVDSAGKPIKTESWHSTIYTRDSRDVMRLRDSVILLNRGVDRLQLFVLEKDSVIRLKQDSIQVLSRDLAKEKNRLKFSKITILAITLLFVGLLLWPFGRGAKKK